MTEGNTRLQERLDREIYLNSMRAFVRIPKFSRLCF